MSAAVAESIASQAEAQSPTSAPAEEPDWFERIAAVLYARGLVTNMRSDSVRARCPSHADQNASLAVKRLDRRGRALLTCFGGCSRARVLAALGLTPREVFGGTARGRTNSRAAIVATYPYTDARGAVIAEKVRDADKEFRWRQPDSSKRDGWLWKLDGLRERGLPSLYRWSELHGQRVVFKVEGEKAADRLVSAGLVATCGPFCSASWKQSRDLLEAVAPHALIVVIADNDLPGRNHARYVAADLLKHAGDQGVTVKVIDDLPVPHRGDVFDFLEHASIDDLLERVAGAPMWSPVADKERRAIRTRERRAQGQRRRRQDARASRVSVIPDRPSAVLTAIIDVLRAETQAPSGRQLVQTLSPSHERHVVYAALAQGVDQGLLISVPGPRRARLYRLSAVHGASRIRTLDREDGPDTQSAAVPPTVSTGSRVSESSKPEASVNTSSSTRKEDLPTSTEASASGHSPHDISSWNCCDDDGLIVEKPTDRGLPITIRVAAQASVTENEAPSGEHASDLAAALVADIDEHQRAIERGDCCGRDGTWPRCRLCRWSATDLLRTTRS